MRLRGILFAGIATTTIAHAQPLDPYAPKPPTAPATAPAPAPTPVPAPAPTPAPPLPEAAPAEPAVKPDVGLEEQIAAALVQRAQELYDARVFSDAKQLAVEALVKSPRGASAEQARTLIKAVNKELGIADEPILTAPPTNPEDKPDLTPITDPIGTDKPEPPPSGPERAGRVTSGVHGAMYTGLIGATVGSFVSKESPAKGAVPIGLASGVVGGLAVPRLVDKLDWHDGQVRTVGSASAWGGVIGGFFGDAVKTTGTKARHVLLGAGIGSTIGVAGGVVLARTNRLSRGDVALIDTLAGMGTLGGLTAGMLMQPVESEAYSVNAIIGGSAGVLVGFIAADKTNTTSRRMVRVAGLALAGGALPFLLYAGIRDGSTNGDERVTGLLATGGLIAGAYLGFRLTRDMDEGLDIVPGKKAKPAPDDDAPVSVVTRRSDGRWELGGLGVQPLSQQLAPQSGLALPLVGGAW